MPANPLLLMTELEAVNAMLAAIGESPVLSLDVATHQDAANALTLLRSTSRAVQEQGWRFNTQDNVLLTRNGSNEIELPANTLRVETTGRSATTPVSYIDGKLRDVQNNSFVWKQDVYVTLTLHYDFNVIPQAARSYIMQLAGHQFIGNEAVTSGRSQFTQLALGMAQSSLKRTESLIRRPNMLTDSYSVAKIAFGRQPFYPAR